MIANSITCIRIACSIALLFCPVFSAAFYVVYIIAGVSDMIRRDSCEENGYSQRIWVKTGFCCRFYSGSYMPDKAYSNTPYPEMACHLDHHNCRDKGG